MNYDQGKNLPGNFASPKALSMRKKQAESDAGHNQHYASSDHIEKPFGRQGSHSRTLLLRSNYWG
jgi:hypothetical protein